MEITDREFWAVVHGLGLGAVFLLAFTGGFAGLWSYRPEWVTSAGLAERLRRLQAGTWIMAIVAWLTVIAGTYIVYPWYRAAAPQGLSGPQLAEYPRSFLLANVRLAEWHTFGMEWKEHVAWFSPILSTAVAFVVLTYGPRLAERPNVRRALMVLFVLAFVAAGIAGVFGAFITKAAPVY